MEPKIKMQKRNKILRLLFEFQSTLLGVPSFLSGNSFCHATSSPVYASNGVFSEILPLKHPKTYPEFFLMRKQNCILTPQHYYWFSKIEQKQKKNWYVLPPGITFDILNPPHDLIKQLKQKFIQLGPGRNRGHGIVRLVDYIWINVDDLDLPEEGSHVELYSSLFKIPKFVHEYKCRKTILTFWNNGHKSNMKVISSKQYFRLKDGINIKKVALLGILRKTIHGRHGLGEYQVVTYDKKNGGA